MKMNNTKVVWDIPTQLKEYHNIEFNHEKNYYSLYGHDMKEYISIPSHGVMDMYYDINDIIHIDFGYCELTIYSTSTHMSIYPYGRN